MIRATTRCGPGTPSSASRAARSAAASVPTAVERYPAAAPRLDQSTVDNVLSCPPVDSYVPLSSTTCTRPGGATPPTVAIGPFGTSTNAGRPASRAPLYRVEHLRQVLLARFEQPVRDVQRVEQRLAGAAHHRVLRLVAVRVGAAAQAHEDQYRDVERQRQRGQRVHQVAEAGVLDQYRTAPAGEFRAGCDSQRTALVGGRHVPPRLALQQPQRTAEHGARYPVTRLTPTRSSWAQNPAALIISPSASSEGRRRG